MCKVDLRLPALLRLCRTRILVVFVHERATKRESKKDDVCVSVSGGG